MFNFITEFGSPAIAFLIGYKVGGILKATLYMLIASIISFLAIYIKERKVNNVNLISSLILLVSGSLTLFSGNSVFIKMKPTALYCIFAFMFLLTSFKGKPAVQHLLGAAIKLKEDRSWYILNFRFMWFFILMACANEFVWRSFSESTWVGFKIFGALPITIIFILLQMPFIMKNKIPDDA